MVAAWMASVGSPVPLGIQATAVGLDVAGGGGVTGGATGGATGGTTEAAEAGEGTASELPPQPVRRQQLPKWCERETRAASSDLVREDHAGDTTNTRPADGQDAGWRQIHANGQSRSGRINAEVPPRFAPTGSVDPRSNDVPLPTTMAGIVGVQAASAGGGDGVGAAAVPSDGGAPSGEAESLSQRHPASAVAATASPRLNRRRRSNSYVIRLISPQASFTHHARQPLSRAALWSRRLTATALIAEGDRGLSWRAAIP